MWLVTLEIQLHESGMDALHLQVAPKRESKDACVVRIGVIPRDLFGLAKATLQASDWVRAKSRPIWTSKLTACWHWACSDLRLPATLPVISLAYLGYTKESTRFVVMIACMRNEDDAELPAEDDA